MKHISIKRGLEFKLPTPPIETVSSLTEHLRWQAPKHMSLNPDNLVGIGDSVNAGDPLFVDKNSPTIKHVAPAGGEITEIQYDDDHRLNSVTIRRDDRSARQFFHVSRPFEQNDVKNLLLESGLWTQLRQLPFNTVPNIKTIPLDILITAIDTRPSAPNPSVVINKYQEEFDAGVEALCTQTQGLLRICQAPGAAVSKTENEKTQYISFSGPHPAGLPCVHAQHLNLSVEKSSMWQVNYQDVIRIGHLLLNNKILTETIVSLSGALLDEPRLINTSIGACVSELLSSQLGGQSKHSAKVGSYLSFSNKQWLDRFDHQITLIDPAENHRNEVKKRAIRGFIPDPIFDRVNTLNILPVPLLRALAISDFEQAQKLGCLELCAEYVDIFSYVCPEQNNYSQLFDECTEHLMSNNTIL